MPVKLSDSDVENLLKDIIGENAYLVLKACEVGRTDEEIDKITGIGIQTVRSLLNQLHSAGLITYTREKDLEHNWFKYTWYTKKDRIIEVVKKEIHEKIDDLNRKLDFETSYMFFVCPNGCLKVPFEIAAEYDFKCPDCGSDLQAFDNSRVVVKLKRELDSAKRLLRKIERYEKEKREEGAAKKRGRKAKKARPKKTKTRGTR